MLSRIGKFLLLLAVSIVVSGHAQGAKLNGAGATSPTEVYNYWIAKYKEDTGNKVSYQPVGSGGGIRQIKDGIIDFGASDEPLKSEELGRYGLLQFPTLIGAVTIVHNIRGVEDGKLKLSNSVVSDIFLGKIIMWNDEKIQELNPDIELPESKIKFIHRSDSSGATYNVTMWLSRISPEWAASTGAGKSVNWRNGVGIRGNDGVARLVKQTPNSLGYIDLSYKSESNLSSVQLQDSSGRFVCADDYTLNVIAQGARFSRENDFGASLILLEVENAYPIASPTFILLPKGAKQYEQVVKFFEYAYVNGDEYAREMGFTPISAKTKLDVIRYLKSGHE